MKVKMCNKQIRSGAKSKYDQRGMHKCHLIANHAGKCEEYPYLKHLRSIAPRVAAKIVRDSTKTTGASWSSSDAGPNRISRWAMLLSDKDLLKLGIKMYELKPRVVAKLREKAASYEQCMAVAQYLTWSVYGMKNAPQPDDETKLYLENFFGEIRPSTTVCLICRDNIDYMQFEMAKRGMAEIETAHAEPRSHQPGNVGFAHRSCNIAQGDKSLSDFYTWISGIVRRVQK